MTRDMLAPSKKMLCKAYLPFPSDDPAVNVLASFKPFSFFAYLRITENKQFAHLLIN